MLYFPHMGSKPQDYEINEEDIDTVLNILKQTDPNNATPDMAIAILEHLQATVHELGHTDPEQLLEIYEGLKKRNQEKKAQKKS